MAQRCSIIRQPKNSPFCIKTEQLALICTLKMDGPTGVDRLERGNSNDMENSLSLSSEDIQMLEPILAELSQRSGRKQTLDRLLSRWERFVSKVEMGYRLSIYDYTNDLSIRDFLQVILNDCPTDIHSRLHEWIESWDNRLILVTKQVEKPLLPPLGEEGLGWWWFQIPLHPGDELKKDLENW